MAKKLDRDEVALQAAYLVLAVWATSFLVDIFVKGYEPPREIQAALMAALTFLFSSVMFRKDKGKDLDKENQDQ